MVLGNYLSSEGGVLLDGWEPEFGFIPTILYCGLITLTIYPFSYVRPEMLKKVGNVHRYTIYAFTFFIVLQGLVVFYLVGDSVTDLLSGDFKYLKDAHYSGDISPADVKMLTMPLPVQMLYLTCFMTLLALPLFFYYTCIEKRSIWLTSPLLAISLSPILREILVADRTEIIHYGLMFLFCLVLFKGIITRKVRNFLMITSVPVAIIGFIYFAAVSVSRFENSDEGAGGSVLEYAGQSYVNFCYFYDNHDRELYYLEREFPLVSFFGFKTQYVDTKEERSAKEGFFVGVFASHVGSWLLDTGIVGTIILSSLFYIICCVVIRRYNRSEFDIAEILFIFTLGAVPTFGIFYYRYYSIGTAFVYLAAGILFAYSKIQFIWEKSDLEQIEK